jgi:hypothetical protein
MWQQANGRAISSSGLREGTLARDCARRVVARSMSGGGRVVEVGIRRLRVRWIEEVVEEVDIFVLGWCWWVWLWWWCLRWVGGRVKWNAREVRWHVILVKVL